MTEPNRKPLIGNILAKLDHMANAFNQSAQNKAAPDKQTAELLAAAAQALRDEQQKNQALQKELDTIKSVGSLKELKRKSVNKSCFHFLIDGSGSMTGKPIKAVLDSVKNFVETTDANVSSAFWGGQFSLRPLPVYQMTDKFDANGLLSGSSYFVPAVDYMQMKASTTKGSQHFVVLSDGDIHDPKEALPKARAFLSSSPKSSVDFVVICDFTVINTQGAQHERFEMGRFAEKLRQEFPNQVSACVVGPNQPIGSALSLIAADCSHKKKPKVDPNPKP